MKKQNLKSLKLNKRSISTLDQNTVVGGTTNGTICIYTVIICPSDTCITTVQSGQDAKPTCGNCDK